MSVIINDPVIATIWQEIVMEYDHACRLHPGYRVATDLRKTAITLEELLESITEMSRRAEMLQKAGLAADRVIPEWKARRVALRQELIQTAAMCIGQLISLEREEKGS